MITEETTLGELNEIVGATQVRVYRRREPQAAAWVVAGWPDDTGYRERSGATVAQALEAWFAR